MNSTNTGIPAMIRNLSTAQLLDVWDLTGNRTEREVADVRGWIMDELERRNPDGFAAWLDQDAPNDKDLRRYITVNHMCLSCRKWRETCAGSEETVWTGCAMKEEARA
jgi:hypothetical protein